MILSAHEKTSHVYFGSGFGAFYFHVTVHRNKFLYNKTK